MDVQREHSQGAPPPPSRAHGPTCKVNLLLGFICRRENSPCVEVRREEDRKSRHLPGAVRSRRGPCCRGSCTQLCALVRVSDQLRRVCTAWEEISSSNSFLGLPALPFSPPPELLGRTDFAHKSSGAVIIMSRDPRCCYFQHCQEKRQKAGPVGTAKSTPGAHGAAHKEALN